MLDGVTYVQLCRRLAVTPPNIQQLERVETTVKVKGSSLLGSGGLGLELSPVTFCWNVPGGQNYGHRHARRMSQDWRRLVILKSLRS